MRLYLDDDSVSNRLVHLLRQAGHDVQLPSDVGNSGKKDAVHLRHAIHEDRVFLTHNYGDFEDLHELLTEARGHHPGICVIRRENDHKRNLRGIGIVRAIQNLLATSVPIADQYVILNQWR
jgi:predicted nuclease of predicted toxin-antitoxin system